MIASRVSDEDRQEAARLTMKTVRNSESDILRSLKALDIDLLGAFAVSAEYREPSFPTVGNAWSK